jgi:hypothetical protein
MGLILYLPGNIESGDVLLRLITSAVPGHEIERYSSIGELSERLHQPVLDTGVAVLYISQCSEMMEIIYMADLLNELKVVLVLPDSQPETLDKAYALCPRFIAVTESDFKHLRVVLNKMMDMHSRMHWT